jgi:hypothetical protein
MEKKHETLNKLNKLLEDDPEFRKKFEGIFDTEEKLTFQVAGAKADDAAASEGGCSCYAGLCGKGCFASYPGSRGHLVG